MAKTWKRHWKVFLVKENFSRLHFTFQIHLYSKITFFCFTYFAPVKNSLCCALFGSVSQRYTMVGWLHQERHLLLMCRLEITKSPVPKGHLQSANCVVPIQMALVSKTWYLDLKMQLYKCTSHHHRVHTRVMTYFPIQLKKFWKGLTTKIWTYSGITQTCTYYLMFFVRFHR